eukprot:gene7777-66833_t
MRAPSPASYPSPACSPCPTDTAASVARLAAAVHELASGGDAASVGAAVDGVRSPPPPLGCHPHPPHNGRPGPPRIPDPPPGCFVRRVGTNPSSKVRRAAQGRARSGRARATLQLGSAPPLCASRGGGVWYGATWTPAAPTAAEGCAVQ